MNTTIQIYTSFEQFFANLNLINVVHVSPILQLDNSLEIINRIVQKYRVAPPEIMYLTEGSTTHYQAPFFSISGYAPSRLAAKMIVYNELVRRIREFNQVNDKIADQKRKLCKLYDAGYVTDIFIDTNYPLVDTVSRRILFGGSDMGKGNEQLAHIEKRQYVFTISEILERALEGKVDLPSFQRTFRVSETAVAYYFSKIKTSLYLDREYKPQTEQDLVITLCHIMHYMYKKGMWRHKNTHLEQANIKLALQNWSNGSQLMTIQQATRKRVKPYNSINKGLQPYFDLLKFVLIHNDPDNLLVQQNEGQVNVWNILRAGVNVVVKPMSAALKYIVDIYLKQTPFIRYSLKAIEYVYGVYESMRDTLMLVFAPLLDKINDPDANIKDKLIRSFKLIIGFAALYYIVCHMVPSNTRTILKVLLPCIATADIAYTFKDEVIEYICSFIPEDDDALDGEVQAQLSFQFLQPIITLVATALYGDVNIPALRDFNIRSIAARNITEFLKYIFMNMREIIDYAYSAFTGRPFFQESSLLQEIRHEFQKWDNYMIQDNVYSQLHKDQVKLQEIIDFNKRLVELDKQVRVMRTLTDVEQRRWATILGHVKQWANAAQSLKSAQATRQAPVWINFVGAPGVGKSTLINILASAVRFALDGKPFTSADRFERQPGKQFWDGYKGQWLVTYDDIYQTADVPTRLQTSMDFIATINCNPLPLNMASLEKKEDTLFTSQLVISTTNTTGLPTDLGITSPDALIRRNSLNILVKRGADIDDITTDACITNWTFTLLNMFGSSNPIRDLTFTDLVSLVVSHIHKEERIAALAIAPPGIDFWNGKLPVQQVPPHKPQPEKVAARPEPVVGAVKKPIYPPPVLKPWAVEKPIVPPARPAVPPPQQSPNGLRGPPPGLRKRPTGSRGAPSTLRTSRGPPPMKLVPTTPSTPPTAQAQMFHIKKDKNIKVIDNTGRVVCRYFAEDPSVEYFYRYLVGMVPYPFTYANHTDITGDIHDFPDTVEIAPIGVAYTRSEWEAAVDAVKTDQDRAIERQATDHSEILEKIESGEATESEVDRMNELYGLDLKYKRVEYAEEGLLFKVRNTGEGGEPNINGGNNAPEEFVGLTLWDQWHRGQIFHALPQPDGAPNFIGAEDPTHTDCINPLNQPAVAYFHLVAELITRDDVFRFKNKWWFQRFTIRELQNLVQIGIYLSPQYFFDSYRASIASQKATTPLIYAWQSLTKFQKKDLDYGNPCDYCFILDRIYGDGDWLYSLVDPMAMYYSCVMTLYTVAGVSFMVWKAVAATFGSYEAESIDKTQKNMARAVYKRNFYGAARAKKNGTYKQPKPTFYVAKESVNLGHKVKNARVAKEGNRGYNPMFDDIRAQDDEFEEIDAQGPRVYTTSLVNRMCLNTIEAEITYRSGHVTVTNLFFVQGTQAFAVKHAFEDFQFDDDDIDCISLFARKEQRGCLMFKQHQFKLNPFDNRDLIRITFDATCPSFRNMTKHLKPFISNNVVERPGRVSWSPVEIKGENLEIRQVEFGQQALAKDIQMNTVTENRSFLNLEWYEVQHLPGSPGLCGYPYINDVESDQTPIIGIHVGGKGDRSMVVPITIEDVDFQAQFYLSNVSKADECLPNETEYTKFDTRHIQSDTASVFNVVPYKGEGLRVVHNLKTKPFIPNKNPISPSPFQQPIQYGKELLPVIHEVTYLPVRLTSVNGEVSPYAKAIDKFSAIAVPPLEKHISEMILDDRMDEYSFGITPRKLKRRRLTEKEVIFGCPELHIPAMDLTTGIGPPECTIGQRTKQMIMADPTTQTYTLDTSFRRRLDYIKATMSSQVLSHIALDMLKIETREKERVESNSTRLFEAGSKASIFMWKTLTGHLLSHVEKYQHEHAIKIGINVHSSEWTELYKDITRFLKDENDPGVNAGDFERWDKTMLLGFSQAMADGIIRNIGYDLEDWEENFIRHFIHGTLQTVHFSPIGLYETRQGNSSGGPATSWLNSYYNVLIHCTAWNELVPEYKWHMKEWASLAIYGDDSYSSVHSDVRDRFNMQTLQHFFKTKFGMSYTSCDKSATIPKFMTLSNSNFLCRKFTTVTINDRKYVLPQLKEDSIKNAVLWIKDPSSPLAHESFVQTVNAALTEWSYYGPDVHTKYRNEYTKRLRALGMFTMNPTFNEIKAGWHMYNVH